jgi:hypothetical protein
MLMLFSINKAMMMVLAIINKNKKHMKELILTCNVIKVATNHNQIIAILISLPFQWGY